MTRSASSTAPIKALFMEALDSLPRPLADDVTDDVFFAIEQNPSWLQAYTTLCDQRGKTTVNTWGGYWVANAVERVGRQQVPARKSKLISSYSKLDQPAPPRRLGKAATETLAGELVFAFYKANKETLPDDVVKVKAEIVELVMSGMSPAQAFETALKLSSY